MCACPGVVFSAVKMDMAYFSDELESKVAVGMEGADQKALESQAYKDIMKLFTVSDVKLMQYRMYHPAGRKHANR